jgi:hypothetical protein
VDEYTNRCCELAHQGINVLTYIELLAIVVFMKGMDCSFIREFSNSFIFELFCTGECTGYGMISKKLVVVSRKLVQDPLRRSKFMGIIDRNHDWIS